MIILHDLKDFAVRRDDPLIVALNRISANRCRIIFSVNEAGQLDGVVTDGDFRRWVVRQNHVDLNVPIHRVSVPVTRSAQVTDPTDKIDALLVPPIDAIPLLDERGRLTAIARRGAAPVRIGAFTIDDRHPTFIVAEIGNNHQGDLETAKRLVDLAVEAKADCAKFQMRDMKSLYRSASGAGVDREDLGVQYSLDLLARFNLPTDDLFRIFDYCGSRGILPLCTPWDMESVEALKRYGIDGFKIASADLTNHDLIQSAAESRKPILLSTGMSREAEIVETVGLLRRVGAPHVILHCNSTYPAPFREINLNYLTRLKEIGQTAVGYSGHERGFSVPVAAVALGARVIEKHFTLDRGWEGNDHKVSLLPDEFAAMVRAIREVEEAMGSMQPRQIGQGELINRETLAKSLVASRTISCGTVIEPDMLAVRSPGRGLQPNSRKLAIGKIARRTIPEGDFLYASDIYEDSGKQPRPYRFSRPWGVPARPHDLEALLRCCDPDFVEYHLSYRDLEIRPGDYLTAPLDVGFVVHCPELFAGDHILDLSHDDEAHRQRSISELTRVIALTSALCHFHPRTSTPMIVVNVGGWSEDGPLPAGERDRRYDRVADVLSRLDSNGTELIVQTMPPFPWHFGGQRYHNLFVTAEEIAAFCRRTGQGLCLDVSHSKLACNHSGHSFHRFIETVAPYVRHLHLADAAGIDGEGIQIGEGAIDFGALAEQLGHLAPAVGFIPEIWQGHKNDGEGFWVALDSLERWFGATAG